MRLFQLNVTKTRANSGAPVKIPKGIIGARVALWFSPEWEGLTKTVVFRAGDVTKDVLDVQDDVIIPVECTQQTGSALEVGVCGTDGENTVAIPTLWAVLGTVYDGADPSGDVTTDPQLPVWAQILEMVTQLEEQGVTQREIEAAIRDFFGGERPVGKTTPEGGEIFNFYTDPVETGDGKVFPGNTARKGAHAKGFSTQAYGEYSSAEGWCSKTGKVDGTGQDADIPGSIAHAEGRETEARGYCTHTEGRKTIATCRYQHVQGKWNVEDTPLDDYGNGKYADIVGGGTSDGDRRNISTLDWNGLGWFAGGLKVGGTGQDDPNAVSVLTNSDADMETIIAAVIAALPVYNGEVIDVVEEYDGTIEVS